MWVDSVCINQADEVEKARHIPLIQVMYSWAEETYVWLGAGDDESYQAIDWIRNRAALMTPIPLGLLAAKSGRKRREERACVRCKLWRNVICKWAALVVASMGPQSFGVYLGSGATKHQGELCTVT